MEDVQACLCKTFQQKFEHKYKKPWNVYKGSSAETGKWFFTKDRFSSRLSKPQEALVRSGCLEKWDTTLLTHALIYSSHFLLVHTLQPDVGKKLDTTQKPNSGTTTLLLPANLGCNENPITNNDILLDLEEYSRLSKEQEVIDVREHEIDIKLPLCKKTKNPAVEWQAVKKLSQLRNSEFAHCAESKITIQDFERVVKDIKFQYSRLNHPDQSLQDILKGI